MVKRIKTIEYSEKFLKSLGNLSAKIVKKAEIREKIFKEDIFNPVLNTHKLHGKEKDGWAFWVDFNYRIKFIFLPAGRILFLDIGTHDIYE